MLKQQLISESKYGVKCPYTMTPKGICIHNTANDAPASNEIAYMQNNNLEVSFHIAIDDVESIQGLPLNRNAWHAGDGGSGNGNRNYIAVEICYSKSGGDKFINAEKRAAKEVAALLKQYGWGVDKVKKHQDFSNKYCPHRTLDMGWQRFLNMIQAELNGSSQPTIPGENNLNVGDRVKVIGANYATGETIPDWVKSNIYEIIQIANNKVLIGGIMSWVYNNDVQKINNNVNSAAPQVENKKHVKLKYASSWRIYPEGVSLVKGNEKGFLNPRDFGENGILTYEILGRPQANAVTIQTRDFGRGVVYLPQGDNEWEII